MVSAVTVEMQVRDFIANQLKIEGSAIKLNTDFAEELGTDSIHRAEMIMFLEDEFGIEVPDEDVNKLNDLKRTVPYVMEKIRRK
jgi:acyl carrier protein